MIKHTSPPPVEVVEKIGLSSKEEEKEKAIKIIEEKFKAFEERQEQDNQNPKSVKKKKSHFWSDFKVVFSLLILVGLAIAAVIVKVNQFINEPLIMQLKIRTLLSIRNYLHLFQVLVYNPQVGITFSETSNHSMLEQNKNSNQKYTGVGYIPDYDGYIS